MKMRYQKLADYLLVQLPSRYSQHFYTWIERGKLINQGKNITDNGIEIAHIEYDAVFYFNELPFKEINAVELMVFIQLWLNDNDPMRYRIDDYESPFELEMINDEVANLSFTLRFIEPITAVKDKQGKLEINGERYTIEQVAVYTASEIHLIDDNDSVKNKKTRTIERVARELTNAIAD